MPASGTTGIILVVSGPSGVGKSTLVRGILSEPGVRMSISCTTRPPRAGEQDGKDYHFVSRREFEERVQRGEFAEHAEVFGNLYGTPRAFVEENVAAGCDVVMDIDVQGARQLKQAYPHGCFVFVLPPSRTELERRLRSRGTESDDKLGRRIEVAEVEMQAAHAYDYAIVNDRIEQAIELLKSILRAERAKTKRVLEAYEW